MEKVHIGYSAVFSNNKPRVGVKKVDNDLLGMHLLVATVAVPSMRKDICVFSTQGDRIEEKYPPFQVISSYFPAHPPSFKWPPRIELGQPHPPVLTLPSARD